MLNEINNMKTCLAFQNIEYIQAEFTHLKVVSTK